MSASDFNLLAQCVVLLFVQVCFHEDVDVIVATP